MKYIVQPGDTLGNIAVKYDTTVSAIVRANGIKNPT
ncbi:LysM peptidoglycan-binding domain-containing protein [Alicyclobacillus sendaiensis]|uniref:LysM peptidoglycan-binding domain-containing protein n=1 Tax=Alicyclobacillus sendaiensis PA2 TaxID=3029425 RepID=A0ABT6XUU0_ALISE|nr:LysM peptidoglycan-binding domain-containing protein [Alicyclobacillus sendaiensis]MDI9258587.1 LysM peptidoglycan-binding domain-containing protein [Alicyclobacillus sendaiensis PA2]